jgi:fumarate hydratase class II
MMSQLTANLRNKTNILQFSFSFFLFQKGSGVITPTNMGEVVDATASQTLLNILV